MAPKITSSSDRSKRQARSKATVRSDKGRKNRQSASTAKTTNSKDRKSTGSARVTTSKSEQKALPPKGGTSANSPKAQYQRGMTRDAQAKQALTTVARGTSRMVRRMNAQDKQEAAAKGTKGTKQRLATATPDRPQLPPAVNRPPAKGSSSATSSSRVEQVKVRDVTPGQSRLGGGQSQARMSGSSQRSLPPGRSSNSQSSAPRTSNTPRLPAAQQGPQPATRRQQAEAKAARAAQGSTGPNRVGQPAGAANRQYGAQRVDGAIGRAQRQSNIAKATSRGIVGGSIAGAILSAPEEIRKGFRLARDPKGAVRKAVDDHMNSIDPPDKKPIKAGNAKSRFPQARRNAEIRTNRIKAATPDTKSANDGQRTRQAEQRRSSGSVTAAPQPRQSSVRPSQSAPRTATAGAGAKGSKWEDFNPGRGTSETTNPLIKKDSWLMGKIKQREDTQSKNVGPVSDGAEYSASKKSAEIVARRKKKEEEDKKKAQQ